ncbi:MAG: FapA family protein [Anaerovorax sp.]|nr:FapA family protein [Anaerovorax sp.]
MSQIAENLDALENEENVTPLPKLDIKVTPDRMMAFLRVSNVQNADYELDKKDILEALKEKGIIFGILENEIQEYCLQKKYYKELKVSKGIEPINGENGDIIFHFDTQPKHLPKELNDGSVDFKDISLIQNVKAGDLLCEIILPTNGTPGKDIFGNEVMSKPGTMPLISAGKNIAISEDELKYTAAVDGRIEYMRDTISIEEVFHVKGDVGPETGNIFFNGSVIISGNVTDGFRVEAKKDIIINGRVEGADIKTDQNVLIRSGMNGMQKGTITAGGDVTSRFIENATVICGGNFCSECTLNAKIHAGRSIIMKGKRAAMLGGTYIAGDYVIAKEIGSELNIPMEINIEPEWYAMEIEGKSYEDVEYAFLDQQDFIDRIKKIEKEAEKFGNVIQDVISGKKKVPIEQKTLYMKQLMGMREEKMRSVHSLQQELDRSVEYQNNHEFAVTCLGNIYPGVRMKICGTMMRVERTATHQKYFVDKGEIIVGVPTANAEE